MFAVTSRKERPTHPDNIDIPEDLWALWERCWAYSAEDRPDIETVFATLLHSCGGRYEKF